MSKGSVFKVIGAGFAAGLVVFIGATVFSTGGRVEGVQTEQEEGSAAAHAAQAGVTEQELEAVIITAERFSERFGTYTNEENYQNFLNLATYSTPSMQAWMENFVREQQEEFRDRELAFYGITTTAIVSEILEARPDRIQILINTKREEITDQSESAETVYQNILVEMQHVDDDWKVNFAQFQET